MNPQRILGIALFAVGLVFLFVGMNSSRSAADQFSNTVTGRFTDNTMWYIVGGISTGVAGLILMLSNFRGKKA